MLLTCYGHYCKIIITIVNEGGNRPQAYTQDKLTNI